MPNNYSRRTYDRHQDKINRIHLCPFSGDYVMPFVDGRGAQHLGHCPKCGTVTYVSMPETVTHEFTSYFKVPQPENLGTCFTISGGEVMELDAHLESQYELNTEEDMPF